LGQELLALIPGLTVHLETNTISEFRTTRNVIAETPTGDPNHVVVVGAHLDSGIAGPGLNDNGSGSATILEVAEVYAQQDREPRNKLRFMWYGAEELNLLGSAFYVNSLSQAERDQIELMLNFDMIGSPNFVRFVYDGDNSAFPPVPGQVQVGPPGSGAIEQVFVDYFASQGLLNAPTPFNGRSDYGPFIAVGIPAGGLFTGAEGRKTAQQVIDYGGIEGAQYDPCYHAACDTFAGTGGATAPGLGLTALDQMSDAVAHAVLLFSKRNFNKNPLVDPVVASALSAKSATQSDGGPHPEHDAVVDR
jgi:Zn-dependent M28 family amino/carboxypeptidase